MSEYRAPTFSRLRNLPQPKPAPKKRGGPRTIPDSVVAAIRWDYEYELVGLRALQRKWAESASAWTVSEIAAGRMRPEVKAAKA